MNERRFIEDIFPIKEVSKESVKEKRLRYGHISTLHVWWARRPLSSSRSTIYASLVPSPPYEQWKTKEDFIVRLSKWENSSNFKLLEEARKEIISTNDGKPPKVLDPFGGGGSIPFEAIRLGCETHVLDYNPVACLILKCVTEFPQRYTQQKKLTAGLVNQLKENKLLTDLKKWQEYVLKETEEEIGKFYPKENNGSPIVGYIWLRTIPCQNPTCGAEIPLTKNYYLSKKDKHSVIFYPFTHNNIVEFKIINTDKESIPANFDPTKGSIYKAVVICPICKSTIDQNDTRRLFSDGKSKERLTVVISQTKGKIGKNYRLATKKDLEIFNNARDLLEKKRKKIHSETGIDPIPDEDLPPTGVLGFRIQRYGFKKWRELFNSRQQLTLITFSEKVRNAYSIMVKEGYDNEYAKAITAYLAIGVDRIANYGSSLCYLNTTGGRGVANTFGTHTLILVPNYAESNPFNLAGAGWQTACETNEEWLKHAFTTPANPAIVKQASAISISYPDNYFDAVFTDPPYYDNIGYSYLSDFFYVWLKRILGGLFPELFSTPLTPKSEELVAYPNIIGGPKKAKVLFEQSLKKSFGEINRVLKPNGIAIIVYAHKSTDGWETLINSLLESGLIITGAWPIHTEMEGRLESRESATLASSIYMVARKWKKEPIGLYREIKKELKIYLNKKLEGLWHEGIAGADFFISAIASAIEVFGKYDKVVDDADSRIEVLKLLNDTREIVTNFAIKQVLHSDFSDQISQMTRFYILWRWAYGELIMPFDDAKTMSQSVGIDLEHEWNKGFISKEKENIIVLGPGDRKIEDLENSNELIDVLHYALILWKNHKKEELNKLLQTKGYYKSDMFKRVAQAISESLPIESTEKKLLDGFLTGFRVDDSSTDSQTKLF